MDKKEYKRQVFPKYGYCFVALVLLIVMIHLFASNQEWVENYYSNAIYPKIGVLLRFITKWLSFSVGDVMYCIAFVMVIYGIYSSIAIIKKSRWNKLIIAERFFFVANNLLVIYLVFIVFWGLNYHRKGIAHQLKIDSKQTYTTNELKNLLCDVIEELNHARLSLGDSTIIFPNQHQANHFCIDAYSKTAANYHFLHYQNGSIKPSLLTEVVSYAGFAGYFNPFSGEAQINKDLPLFIMPFVTTHEMAHQLGYASESEANFVGYLVCIKSSNKWLRYSALFELFAIANNELLEKDFWSAVLNLRSLNSLVKRDRRIYRNYLLGKQNSIEPVMKSIYHQYLMINAQQNGIESYNDLTKWILAYTTKYGKQSIFR